MKRFYCGRTELLLSVLMLGLATSGWGQEPAAGPPFAGPGPVPQIGGPPHIVPGFPPSPVEALQREIDALKTQGKDVTALESSLGTLRTDWEAIESKQQEIKQLLEACRPKVEELMRQIRAPAPTPDQGPAQPTGEASGTGRVLQSAQTDLDRLKSMGRDITKLQTELDELRGTLEETEKSNHGAGGVQPGTDSAAKVRQLQQKLNTLIRRVKTMLGEQLPLPPPPLPPPGR